MKNIVYLNQLHNEGRITIDLDNPQLFEMSLSDFFAKYVPYTRLFERIVVKHIEELGAELLQLLTHQYLHGAEIELCFKNEVAGTVFKASDPNKFYTWSWKPFDINRIPKALANTMLWYHNKPMTFIDALNLYKNSVRYKTLTYIPKELYDLLDDFSQRRIAKAKKYNLGAMNKAEDWYKELQKFCVANHLFMRSPNAKTYYEAIAEMQFDEDVANLQTEEPDLTPEQEFFLETNAKFYGVDIRHMNFRYNSRKTKDGYTCEPELVMQEGMSKSEYEKTAYDGRNAKKQSQLPGFVRQGLRVKSLENKKLRLEAYKWLKYLVDNLGDEALLPEYKRCPECGEIYHEAHGCECGYAKPIDFVSADNLFYGISSSYEDNDALDNYYEAMLRDSGD